MKHLLAKLSGVFLITTVVGASSALAVEGRPQPKATNQSVSNINDKKSKKNNPSAIKGAGIGDPAAKERLSGPDSLQEKVDSGGHSANGAEPSTGENRGDSESPPVSGFDSWTSNPFVVGPAALVILIALGLHLIHISAESKTKQELALVRSELQRLSAANTGLNSTARNAVANLAETVDRDSKTLTVLGFQIEDLNGTAASIRSGLDQATDASMLIADWIGDSRIQALSLNGNRKSESDRNNALKAAGRYKEVFGENAKRVALARDALDRFAIFISGRPKVTAEFIARVEESRQDIRRFEQWDADAGQRLASLEQGSFSERHSVFLSRKNRITDQLAAREISVAGYVQTYRDLVEQCFPNEPAPVVADHSQHEEYLQRTLAGVTDDLMDWFDRLYQLQTLVKTGADHSIEPAIISELVQVLKIAKETLGRFDIQPGEIHAGLTSFDRRLHDTALVMQGSNLPANTVVGVQQCGFRRLSTGEVLRRPKVVVSGAGAL